MEGLISEKDLRPGMRFNHLTVIAPAERKNGRRRYRCLCDCGNETTVFAYSLIRGGTKSCGCLRSPDRRGERFGLLTVVGRTDRFSIRGSRKAALWECRCDCGNTVYKAMDSLTAGRRCSCKQCADRLNAANAREHAGFIEGTMIARLTGTAPVGDNPSGRRGVRLNRKSGRWMAYIKFRKKAISLGTYADLEMAIRAREEAEERYFAPMVRAYKKNEGMKGNRPEGP